MTARVSSGDWYRWQRWSPWCCIGVCRDREVSKQLLARESDESLTAADRVTPSIPRASLMGEYRGLLTFFRQVLAAGEQLRLGEFASIDFG